MARGIENYVVLTFTNDFRSNVMSLEEAQAKHKGLRIEKGKWSMGDGEQHFLGQGTRNYKSRPTGVYDINDKEHLNNLVSDAIQVIVKLYAERER
jgi:hypothetical protein